jgi:outer membrane immunogenic protein
MDHVTSHSTRIRGRHGAFGRGARGEPLPRPPPPLPPPFSWAGFYIGVTAGYDQAAHNFDDLDDLGIFEVGGTHDFQSSGFIGGGTLGYNWQVGTFVYGLETDFSGLTNSTSFTQRAPLAFISSSATSALGFWETFSNRINWLWTVRPRIGLAVDCTLVYFTAGFALAGVHNTLASTGFCDVSTCDDPAPFFNFSSESTRIGYTSAAAWSMP